MNTVRRGGYRYFHSSGEHRAALFSAVFRVARSQTVDLIINHNRDEHPARSASQPELREDGWQRTLGSVTARHSSSGRQPILQR